MYLYTRMVQYWSKNTRSLATMLLMYTAVPKKQRSLNESIEIRLKGSRVYDVRIRNCGRLSVLTKIVARTRCQCDMISTNACSGSLTPIHVSPKIIWQGKGGGGGRATTQNLFMGLCRFSGPRFGRFFFKGGKINK